MNQRELLHAFLQRWDVEKAVNEALIKHVATMGEVLGNGRKRHVVDCRRDIWAALVSQGASLQSIGRAFGKSYDIIHYAVGGDGRRAERFEPVARTGTANR